MNTNDMDRYFRRTGHRWSGDFRFPNTMFHRAKNPGRTVVLIGFFFIVTVVGLLFWR